MLDGDPDREISDDLDELDVLETLGDPVEYFDTCAVFVADITAVLDTDDDTDTLGVIEVIEELDTLLVEDADPVFESDCVDVLVSDTAPVLVE